MITTKNNEVKYDELGRNLNCHFLSKVRGKMSCNILKGFYNDKHSDSSCIGCPFFKTTAEFRKGFLSRSTDKLHLDTAI